MQLTLGLQNVSCKLYAYYFILLLLYMKVYSYRSIKYLLLQCIIIIIIKFIIITIKTQLVTDLQEVFVFTPQNTHL